MMGWSGGDGSKKGWGNWEGGVEGAVMVVMVVVRVVEVVCWEEGQECGGKGWGGENSGEIGS